MTGHTETMRWICADEGEVALVLNAATDAGLSTAQALARAGCRIAVTDRHVTSLARLIQGQSAATWFAVAADPTDPHQVAKLVRRVEDRFGRPVDLIVDADSDAVVSAAKALVTACR